MPKEPGPVRNIRGAGVRSLLGDSITTDPIWPAGSIRKTSPAGQYLVGHGVEPVDFNSYGARRGNHEVMVRGTFANVRLKNQLAPGTEGPFTVHLPDGEGVTIYDASLKYAAEGTPLIVLAGKEYGSGSSRDWAAKGPRLLGVRAVIAESFERIHRSNLVGMGILPLQFASGQNPATLSLTGKERYDIPVLDEMPKELTVTATTDDGKVTKFNVQVRNVIQQRRHHFAGPAPVRIEVDHDRDGRVGRYAIERSVGDGDRPVEEDRPSAVAALGMLLEARQIDAIQRLAKRAGDGGLASLRHEPKYMKTLSPCVATLFTRAAQDCPRGTTREHGHEQPERGMARRWDAWLCRRLVAGFFGIAPRPPARCPRSRIHGIDLHRHCVVSHVPALYAISDQQLLKN